MRLMKIEATVPKEQFKALIELLRSFKDFFAWSPSDMKDIATTVITHQLNIDPMFKPIAQKSRSMSDEKRLDIKVKMGNLVDANFVKEIRFHTGVDNPILVKKSTRR